MTAATRRGRSADRLPGQVGGGPSVVDIPRLVSRWKGPRPMARRLSRGMSSREPANCLTGRARGTDGLTWARMPRQA